MSRRKKRPLNVLADGTVREGSPVVDEYDADKRTIGIGCTGRGSHRRITIGTWDVLGDLEILPATQRTGDDETYMEDVNFVHVLGAPEKYLYLPEDWRAAPHATQPIKCGYCERNMPALEAKLFRQLRILKSAGVSFLDLSMLDAIVMK